MLDHRPSTTWQAISQALDHKTSGPFDEKERNVGMKSGRPHHEFNGERSAQCLVHPRWQCSLRYRVNMVALSHIAAVLAAMSSMERRRPERRAMMLASWGVTLMSSGSGNH